LDSDCRVCGLTEPELWGDTLVIPPLPDPAVALDGEGWTPNPSLSLEEQVAGMRLWREQACWWVYPNYVPLKRRNTHGYPILELGGGHPAGAPYTPGTFCDIHDPLLATLTVYLGEAKWASLGWLISEPSIRSGRVEGDGGSGTGAGGRPVSGSGGGGGGGGGRWWSNPLCYPEDIYAVLYRVAYAFSRSIMLHTLCSPESHVGSLPAEPPRVEPLPAELEEFITDDDAVAVGTPRNPRDPASTQRAGGAP